MFTPRFNPARRSHVAWLAALSLLAATTAASLAGPILPGQTVLLDANDYQFPGGSVLAMRTIPFSVMYRNTGGFLAIPPSVTGSLTESVVRDPSTKTLSFVYGVGLTGEGGTSAAEGSMFAVGDFSGFKTNVAGMLDFEQLAPAHRTKDGAMILFQSDSPGVGGPPTLVIHTNATQFAPTGASITRWPMISR